MDQYGGRQVAVIYNYISEFIVGVLGNIVRVFTYIYLK